MNTKVLPGLDCMDHESEFSGNFGKRKSSRVELATDVDEPRARFFANIGNFRDRGGRPFDSMTESRGVHCSLTTHGTGDTGGPIVVRLHT